MPETFLADLIGLVETFEEAIQEREEGKGGSTAPRRHDRADDGRVSSIWMLGRSRLAERSLPVDTLHSSRVMKMLFGSGM